MPRRQILVAIDPAAVRFAFAVGTPDALLACAYATGVEDIPHLSEDADYRWLLETPRKYQNFGVAHRDLDRLARTVSGLRRWAEGCGHVVETTYPGAWKGNVPKHIHHQRLLRTLTSAEQALLPDRPRPDMGYSHDVYDAVGIYLFLARRTGRGGT